MAERFWAKVDKGGPIQPNMESPCWVWTASRTRHGYGYFASGRKMARAHRISWVMTHGEIADGIHVLHRCDNPSCVRPDHLFLGTNDDNVRDKCLKGRHRCGVGENQGNSKLNTAAVLKIRERLAAGASRKDIASEFGIGQTTVSSIKHRKSWAHI